MCERTPPYPGCFDADAVATLSAAKRHSYRHAASEVHTPYLLLGILEVQQKKHKGILYDWGLNLYELQSRLADYIGDEGPWVTMGSPSSERLYAALCFAIENAKKRRAAAVTTDDLLFGAIRSDTGFLCKFLTQNGLSPTQFLKAVGPSANEGLPDETPMTEPDSGEISVAEMNLYLYGDVPFALKRRMLWARLLNRVGVQISMPRFQIR